MLMILRDCSATVPERSWPIVSSSLSSSAAVRGTRSVATDSVEASFDGLVGLSSKRATEELKARTSDAGAAAGRETRHCWHLLAARRRLDAAEGMVDGICSVGGCGLRSIERERCLWRREAAGSMVFEALDGSHQPNFLRSDLQPQISGRSQSFWGWLVAQRSTINMQTCEIVFMIPTTSH